MPTDFDEKPPEPSPCCKNCIKKGHTLDYCHLYYMICPYDERVRDATRNEPRELNMGREEDEGIYPEEIYMGEDEPREDLLHSYKNCTFLENFCKENLSLGDKCIKECRDELTMPKKEDKSVPNMIIQLDKLGIDIDYFKKEFTELFEKAEELTEKLKVIYTHHYPDKKT